MFVFFANGRLWVPPMDERLRAPQGPCTPVVMTDGRSGTSVIARSCAREDREFRQARKGATVPIISLCRGGA